MSDARWAQKWATAEQAVAKVPAGTRILIGSGAGEPESLVNALCAAPHLTGNEVVHLLTLGSAPYCAPPVSDRLRQDYNNGVYYYDNIHGRELRPPSNPAQRPAREFLEWHREHCFLG